MEKERSTFDKVDNMLVDCGSFAGIMQIVCSVILILCFCGFGYFFFSKKETRVNTSAIVLHGECKTYSVKSGNSSRMQTDCMLDIQYKVGEEMVQQKITTVDKIHTKDEIIQVKYDPLNPLDVVYNEVESRTVGLILFGIGALFVLFLIIHVVLLNVSDWYKRLMCLNMIGSAFSGPSGFGSGSSGFGGIGPSFNTSFG